MSRAREHFANRAYQSARQTLTRGAEQWPDLEFHHEWLTVLGNVAFRQQCFREARRLLNLACRDEDAHVEAKFMLGRCMLEAGRFERAVHILDGILKDEDGLVPYRVHAGGALSVAYSALGLNKSSQDALELASEFGLISAQLLADEGFRLMRIGAYPEAEVQLAKGLQVDSTCEDAFFRLCNTLFIQQKIEPAMEVLAYGIEQSPEFVPFYQLMSELYSSRGQYKESGAFLRRALEISPDCDAADMMRFMLARALQRSGRYKGAVMAYNELLNESPRSRYRNDVKLRLEALDNLDEDADAARLAPFPRKLQKRAYCAPNTLANVLSYVGAPTAQEEVAARVFRGTGTHWPEVFDYLKDTDDIAFRGFFGTVDLLKRCIENNVPVITTEHYGMSGHALAVIGYDDVGRLVIAQDPRFLEPVEIPYSQFEKSWLHDDGLCVAVTGKDRRNKLPGISGDEESLVREFVALLRTVNEGDVEAAMRAALDLSQQAPEKQAPLRILAETALQQRGVKQLKQFCDEALRKWPDCFWALRHKGDALWMEDDLDGALKHYHRAQRVDRRDESLHYALGELLTSRGEKRRGRAWLLRALSENPRFHRARMRLAEDLFESGQPEDAKFHARLLVEYNPDDPGPKDLLAKIAGNTMVRNYADSARQVNEEVQQVQDETQQEEPGPGNGSAQETEEVEIDLDDL